ncbi:hypothetical protein DFH09DRAFT_1382546 [Mycena vulgaris]|nr:hypothetical protein DFH09DRAFT_1382546 [Mycena vulgaris]
MPSTMGAWLPNAESKPPKALRAPSFRVRCHDHAACRQSAVPFKRVSGFQREPPLFLPLATSLQHIELSPIALFLERHSSQVLRFSPPSTLKMNTTAKRFDRDALFDYSRQSSVLQPVNTDHQSIWGQKLYVGSPNQWMTPELREGEDVEPAYDGPQPIFHLPSFFRDPNFTGDAYFPTSSHPVPRPATNPDWPHYYCPAVHSLVHVGYALAPQWPQFQPQYQAPRYPTCWPDVRKPAPQSSLKEGELAPPWPRYNDPQYNLPTPPASPPAESQVAPPWPHYKQPHLHPLPPSRSPSPSPPASPSSSIEYSPPVVEPSPRPPVFHAPTPQELTARLKIVRSFCNLRARQADLDPDLEETHRAAAEGGIALPPSPPPRVFVPPSSSDTTPSASEHSSSISPSASDSMPGDGTPFRYIPPLVLRFPRYFRATVAGARLAGDAASQHTWTDSESTAVEAPDTDWVSSDQQDDDTLHSTAVSDHHSAALSNLVSESESTAGGIVGDGQDPDDVVDGDD